MTEKKDVTCLPGHDNGTDSNNPNAGIARIPEIPFLYRKVLDVIEKYCSHDTDIISFSEVNHTLSWLLHLQKNERGYILRELEQMGLIRIYNYHGIKILKQEREAKNE